MTMKAQVLTTASRSCEEASKIPEVDLKPDEINVVDVDGLDHRLSKILT